MPKEMAMAVPNSTRSAALPQATQRVHRPRTSRTPKVNSKNVLHDFRERDAMRERQSGVETAEALDRPGALYIG